MKITWRLTNYIILVLSIIILILTLQGALAWYVPEDYWEQDGNQLDDAARAFNLQGNTLTYMPGLIGAAGVYNESITTTWGYNTSQGGYIGVHTFDFWVYPVAVSTEDTFIALRASLNTSEVQFFVKILTNNAIYMKFKYNGTTRQDQTGNNVCPSLAWCHIVVTLNASDTHLFVNGVHQLYFTNPHNVDQLPLAIDHLTVGSLFNTEWYTGGLDNIALFNATYSAANVTDSYNAGAGTNFSVSSSVIIHGLTVHAADYVTGTTIEDFLVTVYNNSFSYTKTIQVNTSGETAFFVNVTNGNYTVNVTNNQYFNISQPLELLGNSSTVTINLTQATLTVEAYHNITGTQLLPFNITYGSQSNRTENGTSFLFVSGGVNTLHWSALGYFPQIHTLMHANLSKNYFRLNVSNYQLNVTADFVGNPIFSFTAQIQRQTGDFVQDVTTSTTNGITTFNLINGTYNVSIVADGYTFADQILQLNTSNNVFQLNFSLLQTNTYNITFLDLITHQLIDFETISFGAISTPYSFNTTTSNGTLTLPLLFPTAYTFRYSGPSYNEQFFEILISNGTYTNIAFYLLNNTLASTITITILDEINNELEGATIHVYRYDITTDNYILHEILTTDFSGEAQFQGELKGELKGEYYKFFVYYDGVLRKTTNRAYLTSTSLTLSILTSNPVGQIFSIYKGILFNLSYDNSSYDFNYVYSDPGNHVTRGCLYIYRLGTLNTLINSSCATGTANSVTLGFTPSNNSIFRADAFVTYEGEDHFLVNAFAEFLGNYYIGRSGGFYILLLFIVVILIGAYSIPVSVLSGAGILLLGAYIGWLPIPIWVATGMMIVAIAILAMISQKTS